jgi:DNA-binding NtrC family response regulator
MLTPQILIVDDEPEICRLLSSALEEGGFRVASAENADDALTLLRENKAVELLLSDIRMPRVDGYSLAEAGLKLNSDLKILLMTGHAELPPTSLLQAREIRTIYKPLDLDRLCELVGGMLSTKWAPR